MGKKRRERRARRDEIMAAKAPAEQKERTETKEEQPQGEPKTEG